MSVSNEYNQGILPSGHMIHWYEIGSILGRGGFGITYLATDTNLQRPVAIKEYFPSQFSTRLPDLSVGPLNDGTAEIYHKALRNFIAEAQTLARFKHDNIVNVHSIFEFSGTAYMVMSYEEGNNLATLYANDPHPFDETFLRSLLLPIIDGLSAIHDMGFIHRDIKPANIVIRDSGTPVLIDFGSARQVQNQQITQLTVFSSFGYSPIEMYSSNAGDQGPWSDIYSLSAAIYEGIVQRKPSDAMERSGAMISGRDDPLTALIGDPLTQHYQPHFLQSLDVALSLMPQQRPQSLQEWRRMLDNDPDLDRTRLHSLPHDDDATMLSPLQENNAQLNGLDSLLPDSPSAAPPEQPWDPTLEPRSPAQTASRDDKVPTPWAKIAIGSALLAVSLTGAFIAVRSYQERPPTAVTKAPEPPALEAPLASPEPSKIVEQKPPEPAADPVVTATPVVTPEPAPKPTPVVVSVEPAAEPTPAVTAEPVAEPTPVVVISEPAAEPAFNVAAINAQLAELECAELSVNDNRAISGLVTASEMQTVKASLQDSFSQLDSSALVVLDDVFCAPLSTLIARKSNRVRLTTEKENNLFQEGERLVVNVDVELYDTNFVYVDYFAIDGSVLHMLSSRSTISRNANQFLRGEDMWLGEPGDIERWDVSGPFGTELISVLVSDKKIDIDTSNEAEAANSYLQRITTALSDPTVQAASNYMLIKTTGK